MNQPLRQSWSHKLFLRVNASIGKNKARDRFMSFAGYWLLFILAFLMIGYGVFEWIQGNGAWLILFIELFLSAFIFAEAFSYLFAFIFRHPRPIVEFPNIIQLRIPIETWKSFPSDHAIASFSLAGILLLLPGTAWWFIILTYMCASLISIARVYIGVHYPRDIIGGFVVAHAAVWLSPWIFYHIIEPFVFLW
jgi:undecaprenyl-diphosphatase